MPVKIWSKNSSIETRKVVELQVLDFVGVAYLNRLMLTINAVLPSNICFNPWINENLVIAMVLRVYVCMYFSIYFHPMFHFYTPWKRWFLRGYRNKTLAGNGLISSSKYLCFSLCSQSQWNGTSSCEHHLVQMHISKLWVLGRHIIIKIDNSKV